MKRIDFDPTNEVIAYDIAYEEAFPIQEGEWASFTDGTE